MSCGFRLRQLYRLQSVTFGAVRRSIDRCSPAVQFSGCFASAHIPLPFHFQHLDDAVVVVRFDAFAVCFFESERRRPMAVVGITVHSGCDPLLRSLLGHTRFQFREDPEELEECRLVGVLPVRSQRQAFAHDVALNVGLLETSRGPLEIADRSTNAGDTVNDDGIDLTLLDIPHQLLISRASDVCSSTLVAIDRRLGRSNVEFTLGVLTGAVEVLVAGTDPAVTGDLPHVLGTGPRVFKKAIILHVPGTRFPGH